MNRKQKTSQKRRKKKRIVGELCNNYLKHCPMAGRCDNCKYRGLRRQRNEDSLVEWTLFCREGHDIEGDHFNCFVCAEEGKCKARDND